MPVAVPELPTITDYPRKRWTRTEYEAISALPGLKVELIEGELINKLGKE